MKNEERKVIGVYSTGLCGIEVAEIVLDYGEHYAIWRFWGTDAQDKWHRSKINTTARGSSYFRSCLGRIHLCDVIKIY